MKSEKTVADVLLGKDPSLVPQISEAGWDYLRSIPTDSVDQVASARQKVVKAGMRLTTLRQMHRSTCGRMVEVERRAQELERIGKWLGNWRSSHGYAFPQQGDATVAMQVQQVAVRLHHALVEIRDLQKKIHEYHSSSIADEVQEKGAWEERALVAEKALKSAREELLAQASDPDREMYETEQRDIGAEIIAGKFQKIAETGVHKGVFGSKSLEACADAILKLHEKNPRSTMGFGQGRKQ